MWVVEEITETSWLKIEEGRRGEGSKKACRPVRNTAMEHQSQTFRKMIPSGWKKLGSSGAMLLPVTKRNFLVSPAWA